MNIYYHKRFIKHYKKRILPNKALASRFQERLLLFQENPQHILLQDHALGDELKGFRSFSITGDIRVL